MTKLLESTAKIDTLANAGQETARSYSTDGAALSITKAIGLLV